MTVVPPAPGGGGGGGWGGGGFKHWVASGVSSARALQQLRVSSQPKHGLVE